MNGEQRQACWMGLGGGILLAWCYTVYSLENPIGDGAVFAGVCTAISVLIAGVGGYVLRGTIPNSPPPE